MEGRKDDEGKYHWHLVPGSMEQVVMVLMHGAAKYGADNWKLVDDWNTRYYNAAMRHMRSWLLGELNDSESGYSHLAHAVSSLLFLMWLQDQTKST